MAEKPKNPRNFEHACRAGWKIVARPRSLPRARWWKNPQVYELYGFEPVETPAMEFTDALGKFLPDQDRPNEGVFSFQDDDEQWICLRYDLTAPLARYVAENFDQLPNLTAATAPAMSIATRSPVPAASASSCSSTQTR
jgi:histidyl-tRNA synthetase